MTKPTSKSFANTDALARASKLAVTKMAAKAVAIDKTPAKQALVQFNVKIPANAMRKFKAIALAWDTSPREMLEAFIAQLPDVMPPTVAAPDAVAWAKPKN